MRESDAAASRRVKGNLPIYMTALSVNNIGFQSFAQKKG
jgi:hypothetical protein